MAKRTQALPRTAVGRGARWTPDDAARLLDEWAESGTPLATFARQRGIVAQRLSWWKKRVRQTPRVRREPAFLPIAVSEAAPAAAAAVVRIDDAICVELRMLDSVSAAWVAALTRAMGAVS